MLMIEANVVLYKKAYYLCLMFVHIQLLTFTVLCAHPVPVFFARGRHMSAMQQMTNFTLGIYVGMFVTIGGAELTGTLWLCGDRAALILGA